MTFSNCEQDLNILLCDIPFEWRAGIAKALCVLVNSEKYNLCDEVKRCETVTALSPFTLQGNTLSLSYKDEKGQLSSTSTDVLTLFNKTLDSLAPSCMTSSDGWASMNFTQRMQVLVDECPCHDISSMVGDWVSELPPCFDMSSLEGVWSSECTAVKNLTVSFTLNGNFISFEPADQPPTDGYTIRRRKKSDPDVPQSYSLVKDPGYNSSTGKWETNDDPGIDNNTKYIYAVTSNCDTPAVAYTEFLFCEVVANVSATKVTEGVKITFNLRTAPPEHGFRVKYRQVGTTSYTYQTFTPTIQNVIEITLNVNPAMDWEGTIEGFCDVDSYSAPWDWSTIL